MCGRQSAFLFPDSAPAIVSFATAYLLRQTLFKADSSSLKEGWTLSDATAPLQTIPRGLVSAISGLIDRWQRCMIVLNPSKAWPVRAESPIGTSGSRSVPSSVSILVTIPSIDSVWAKYSQQVANMIICQRV